MAPATPSSPGFGTPSPLASRYTRPMIVDRSNSGSATTVTAASAVLPTWATPAVGAATSGRIVLVYSPGSTPLPTWTYMGGFIGASIVIAFVGVFVMLTMGVVFYELEIDAAKMPAAFVTLLVGVFAFAALGMALVSM